MVVLFLGLACTMDCQSILPPGLKNMGCQRNLHTSRKTRCCGHRAAKGRAQRTASAAEKAAAVEAGRIFPDLTLYAHATKATQSLQKRLLTSPM